MAAQQIVLTTTPQQITDGTKSAYVQVITGDAPNYACVTSQPNTSTDPSVKILRNDLSISYGFPIWMWVTNGNTTIVVLTSE